MSVNRPPGVVMLDVAGTVLTAEERERLSHPQAGGVILFARNYESPQQLRELTAAIRRVREPALLVGVDHEGGRVQRFRDGFTRIPPMAKLGCLSPDGSAREAASAAGKVIAFELAAHGVDFSFAPVLDLDYGRCEVIGDRAFAAEPARVADLAEAFVLGLRAFGMAAVGKHFPGHGFVQADSHVALPVDERPFEDIERRDLVPYARLIPAGLEAVMPAHVVYPAMDSAPAGFSRRWLQDILRGRLGFEGLVFSDDLSMEGARVAGDIVQRALAALSAGCDMVLVCNDPAAAATLLERLHAPPVSPQRAERMRLRPAAAGRVQYEAALRVLDAVAAR